jgi:hypothetical protein
MMWLLIIWLAFLAIFVECVARAEELEWHE